MEIAEICSLISDVNVKVWWSSLMRPVFFICVSFHFLFSCLCFLLPFPFHICFRGSSHSGRSKVTRVTVGRDTKVFEFVKLILRP